MTLLYFVRHGSTDLVGKQLCGNLPGIHLNENGRLQAERAAEYLSVFPIKAIFCSPLERTRETAEIIAEKQNLTAIHKEFLREINFGDYQGMGVNELNSLELWNQFLLQPSEVRFPNGETVLETQQRVVEGLDQTAANYSEKDMVVFVAHCEVIRLAIAFALGLPINHYPRLTIQPASISTVVWEKDKHKLLAMNYCP